MNVERYLKRLGISGKIFPDIEHLQILQQRHLFKVPFENIDIYHGIPVEYSLESFYRKIVGRERGGYCYELNGLFQWMLTCLGYNAALVSALVMGKTDFISEFEHEAIIVNVEGSKWLVDAGFGNSSLLPIQLIPGKIQNDGFADYRLVDDIIIDGKICMALEKRHHGIHSFVPLYYFTLERRMFDYFMIMHEYQEVVPAAYYKQNLICSLPTQNGRISIVNNRLIETKDGAKKLSAIKNTEDRLKLLRKLFGVNVYNESNFVGVHI